MYMKASAVPETSENTWNLLWLYIPDYTKNGQMASITEIPNIGQTYDDMEAPYYWEQTDSCAGFEIKPDCPWRIEEM